MTCPQAGTEEHPSAAEAAQQASFEGLQFMASINEGVQMVAGMLESFLRCGWLEQCQQQER